MKRKTNSKGLVTLIFILVIALIATLILMIGQSRLFLALQRGQSYSDTIIAGYQAESEINDVVYRVVTGRTGGLTFPYTKELGPNFSISVNKDTEDGMEYIDATASRAFAVSKVRANLSGTTETTVIGDTKDIILMLDCTGSMSQSADPGGAENVPPTRFTAQKEAAINFVRDISVLPNSGNIRLGVGVFTGSAKWLKAPDGREVRLNSGISFNDISNAIDRGFGYTRDASEHPWPAGSPACDGGPTNIEGGMIFAHDNLLSTGRADANKIAILITDGAANEWNRSDAVCRVDSNCSSDQNCFRGLGATALQCALTPNTQAFNQMNVSWYGSVRSQTNRGRWNMDVTRYVVTVLENDPQHTRTINVLNNLLGSDYYIRSEYANTLSTNLKDVFTRIVSTSNSIIIKRVIPEGN